MKRTVILPVVLATLFLANAANAALFGGVDFPQGSSSFADQVVSFSPGVGTVSPYNQPVGAIGAPNYVAANDTATFMASNPMYISLGGGGSLVLRFTDNSLTTSGNSNLDLWIFEIGPAVEPMFVDISQDGVSWISVGDVGGAIAGVNIDAFAGVIAGARYSFVRLTDKNLGLSSSPFAGADIDAVGAISSAAPVFTAVPEPGTIALLGLGLGGLAINLRRARRER